MTDFDMTAYLGVFLDEVDEQLQILDEQILELEKGGYNHDVVQCLFRAAHTIKGSSAAMGFEKLKQVTHSFENILDLIRHEQLSVNHNVIDLFFNCIDAIRDMKRAIIEGSLDKVETEALLTKLEHIQNGLQFEYKQDEKVEHETDIAFPVVKFDEYQKNVIEQALQSNLEVMAVYISLVDSAIMKSVRALLIHNNLKQIGEIISCYPSAIEIEDEAHFNGHLVYILVTSQDKQAVFNIVNSISEIRTVSISKITNDNLNDFSRGTRKEIIIKEEHQEDEGNVNEKGKVKISPTVRVDIARLEHLMNLVGELVIDQTRLSDARSKLEDLMPNHPTVETVSEISNHFSQVISELQEGMMKTRMLPIEQLFNRFPRMVRDLAQKSNKEIEFTILGKETELDRNLIDEISDPIIHLLRNAIDHGVESQTEREVADKPEKGQVLLKASHEENHIVITISDDGRGIDADKIARRAVEKGIVTHEEIANMTEKDKRFLIFHSGVSTAEKVSDISGRGVGMDIVRSHIEKLNGIIDIESEIGQGSTFTIKLPLTLAIISSLLVQLGEREFAIPLANVQEIEAIDVSQIKTIKNQEVGIVRNRVIPLVRLHEYFGIKSSTVSTKRRKRSRVFVVVIGLADKRVGLIVDKTLGNRDVVIKPLGKYVGTPRYIAGATIMGDGSVALIIDALSIAREEGTNIKVTSSDKIAAESKKEDEQLQIVTFKLGTEEFAAEIAKVKDIIPVPHITEMINAPFSVIGMIHLRGELIPVFDLRERFSLQKQPLNRKSRIMILAIGNQLAGVLVDQVSEVMKLSRDVMEAAPANVLKEHENFIEGVCHLENRLLTLVDFDTLLQLDEVKQLQVL
ncbi:chemotaxis protein CheA [Bacillus sp. HMF5848]|uniref:chemotaxis protein CheW n=1 Tax=Bacillus sp. HMF5848 TaxID=2495421 RepID=UPI000F78CA61|nr:chemotaxis protein CheW [Bacillus sp. HMF5848]RSK28412.1 chemotaxis protein CheA [Bacillus sp. HMF5848]